MPGTGSHQLCFLVAGGGGRLGDEGALTSGTSARGIRRTRLPRPEGVANPADGAGQRLDDDA